MRLTILGGGGFRVPLVHAALLADARSGAAPRITELVLYDTDSARLGVVESILAAQAEGVPETPAVRVERELDGALRGADFVFSAIRVGGTEGRVQDERVPLAEGVLGQETVGAGGVLYGLRTVPVAVGIAERVRAVAPGAWVINFTNPAGIVTEAMARVLGERVIGICDSPVGLVRRAARAVGADPDGVEYAYTGLNHLGWLGSLRDPERGELLPTLLSDPAALASFEEGRLFGAQWLAALGALPNEYLHYYYFRRETLRSVQTAGETRGEFLRRQQGEFFDGAADAPPHEALRRWEATRQQREETYLADSRAAGGGWQRDTCDLEGGGYDAVAMALMRALSGGRPARLVLNVPNRGAVPALADGAIVETVCEVGADGPRPLGAATLDGAQQGLVAQVKEVELATVEAALTSSRQLALRALGLHPLVDSPAAAARILERVGW
ncbi:6-phospho-beta-glucosidase [Streptomyces sulphureus]|uniref:family 4 glycosyl hydrolase n=1 Tax=Streptomyces sulphureus TaxID=47758 RepID=UPI0003A2ED93|nr:6-phospho-beta-glucosidase [Streptomyces sulphureus]